MIFVRSLLSVISVCAFFNIHHTSASDDSQAEKFFQKGNKSYKDKLYPSALYEYQSAYDMCHLSAGNNLGHMYLNAEGTDKDISKALEIFKDVAGKGQADAQYNLGHMILNGIGIQASHVNAYDWFEKSAAQGSTLAKKAIADVYQGKKPEKIEVLNIISQPSTWTLYQISGWNFDQDTSKKVLDLKQKMKNQNNANHAKELSQIYYQEANKCQKSGNLSGAERLRLIGSNYCTIKDRILAKHNANAIMKGITDLGD